MTRREHPTRAPWRPRPTRDGRSCERHERQACGRLSRRRPLDRRRPGRERHPAARPGWDLRGAALQRRRRCPAHSEPRRWRLPGRADARQRPAGGQHPDPERSRGKGRRADAHGRLRCRDPGADRLHPAAVPREPPAPARCSGAVATILTETEVAASDPAFAKPSKPVGPFYEARAMELQMEQGFIMREDAGRGWRRVVPSPEPVVSSSCPPSPTSWPRESWSCAPAAAACRSCASQTAGSTASPRSSTKTWPPPSWPLELAGRRAGHPHRRALRVPALRDPRAGGPGQVDVPRWSAIRPKATSRPAAWGPRSTPRCVRPHRRARRHRQPPRARGGAGGQGGDADRAGRRSRQRECSGERS